MSNLDEGENCFEGDEDSVNDETNDFETLFLKIFDDGK